LSKVILSKDFSVEDLKQSVKDMAYFEVKFSDIDYSRDKEDLEKEAYEHGGNFKGHIIDMQTANMLCIIYDALVKQNPDYKIKFERMLKTFTNFEKLVKFGWSKVK